MKTQSFTKTKEGIDLWKDLPEPIRNGRLHKAIIQARERIGQHNIDAGVYEIAKKDTKEIIEENYSWFSIDEIEDVFYLGAIGHLGDNISISTRTIANWFSTYIFQYRTKIFEYIKSKQKALPESTEQRRLTEEELQDFIQNTYEAYHETGYVASFVWDILDKYGKIKNTNEEIKRFLKQAESLVKIDVKEKVESGRINAFEYVNTINSASKMEDKIDSKAKQLAVGYMFDKMKLKEKPVKAVEKKKTLKGLKLK